MNVRNIIVFLLLTIATGGKAQEKELPLLFTDRDFYTSGETILFNILAPVGDSSRVIKIDLINTNGRIIAGVSKNLKKDQASGYLYLADSLNTGNYLLCTTLNGSEQATVKELFICNRFLGLPETSTILQASEIRPIREQSLEGLVFEGLNKTYKTRENVHASIHLSGEIFSRLKGPMFLSVAEIIPGYSTSAFAIENPDWKNKIVQQEGIVLMGQVKDPRTGTPFQNACIQLSVPDSIPWLDYYITGEDGLFSFRLDNYRGKIPVIVQGYDLNKKNLLKIELHRRDSLPSFVPPLSTRQPPAALLQHASGAIEATTLRKIYNCQELDVEMAHSTEKHDYPFYGVPTEIIYPRLFMDLPDFTEISRELLPGVKFRAYNRIPTMQILNPATLNYFNDPPLVTVDGIPVRDLNIIKNLGSKDIERIEIGRKERFFGDLTFHGVVAINLAKHDNKLFPESGELIKFEFDAVQPAVSLKPPQFEKMHEPDLRKVLLWESEPKSTQTFNLEFKTSDIQGFFKIFLRGKTEDGLVFYKEQTFEVK
jgi:hypothetical protein